MVTRFAASAQLHRRVERRWKFETERLKLLMKRSRGVLKKCYTFVGSSDERNRRSLPLAITRATNILSIILPRDLATREINGEPRPPFSLVESHFARAAAVVMVYLAAGIYDSFGKFLLLWIWPRSVFFLGRLTETPGSRGLSYRLVRQ